MQPPLEAIHDYYKAFSTLGEAAAFVRGVAVRYTAAGPEMERVPFSYLMRRGEAGWRIAVPVAEG